MEVRDSEMFVCNGDGDDEAAISLRSLWVQSPVWNHPKRSWTALGLGIPSVKQMYSIKNSYTVYKTYLQYDTLPNVQRKLNKPSDIP